MRTDKSITVLGRSVDDALDVAAEQLAAHRNSLAYEVVQSGLVDQNGSVKIPFFVKAVAVSEPLVMRSDEAGIASHEIDPPFTREQLNCWLPTEFLHHLETVIVNQPEIFSEAPLSESKTFLPTTEIKENIGPSRTIDCEGDLIIHGNVSAGVTIRSGGSVTIFGNVDDAQIEAKQVVNIDGGFLGAAKSMHGGFSCAFAQGANVACAGAIDILSHAHHCVLISGTFVSVGKEILGGSCSAPESINASIVGSETGVVTRLYSGKNARVRDEAEAVRQKALLLVSKLSETTRDIKQFSIKEFNGIKGSVEERLKLWAAMSEKVWLNDQLIALSKRKNALLLSIDQDRTSVINVSDKVHPQTQIEIDDVGITVKKLIQSVTFTKDHEAGAVKVTSFPAPSPQNVL